MNFLSNVLDSIPVVGHVKGVVHYAVGDTDGGNKAMYQSTRTTAVLVGGAAGCVAGPAGAAVGAMYAGLATDGLASIAMDKPQGIVQSCENISKDIASGRNPTGSILSTGLQLGLDGVGGLGMGGISGAASNVGKNVGKKALSTVGEEVIEKSVKLSAEEMAKLVGKKVSEKAMQKAVEKAVVQAEFTLVTAHIAAKASQRTKEEEKEEKARRAKAERERRDREERERKERERQREREERERRERERQANAAQQQSPPPQPPHGNNNRNNKNEPDYFDMFIKLLKRLLKLVYGNNNESISQIFRRLSEGQINYLITIIESLLKSNTLEEVVELVIRIFKDHMPENISFENFLSLSEIVRTYLLDELDTRGTESTAYTQGTYEQRRARIITDIKNEKGIVEKIVRLIEKLQKEIKAETAPPNQISPDFRDIFAAVYHYYKHRCVPEDGILSVKQYYDWIRMLLKMLKKNRRYQREVESQWGPVTCRYEIYVVLFGRRFRVVVKVRRGGMVLSSAFVVNMVYEGDEFIDIRKK